MRNEKWYKETFDQVHVPDKLLGKVMNMENQTKEKRDGVMQWGLWEQRLRCLRRPTESVMRRRVRHGSPA